MGDSKGNYTHQPMGIMMMKTIWPKDMLITQYLGEHKTYHVYTIKSHNCMNKDVEENTEK